jgi:class 3 adenylate cyclase/putative methionine-R-sulfoxide reductase with GAF domain
MVSDKQKTTDQTSLLTQERDMFKRQFLKVQENYENKIKELSILKELGSTLRCTDFYHKNAFFWNQLQIIKKYKLLQDISLMLLNQELQVLEVVATSDFGGPISHSTFLPIEDGPPGQAIVQRSPVIIDNVGVDPSGEKQEGNDDGSLLCVPVMHNKRAIGVLSLRHRKTKGFDQNQMRFFSLVADQIATAVILFRLYDQMLKEEKHRSVLSRFFSKTVTEKILGSEENLSLGGERKSVTILFADLCGFTAMSEGLEQNEVVEILNVFFSYTIPIIFKYDGTLDKLMGDGVMAFFGAPLSHEDDPLRAVQAAIEIVMALKEFNIQPRDGNWPPLEVSVGISSGEVVAGYIGSEDHFTYTVIGDPVNVAKRLESIAASNEILISKRVRDEIQERVSEVEGLKSLTSLPAQKLKGKEKAIDIYRVET